MKRVSFFSLIYFPLLFYAVTSPAANSVDSGRKVALGFCQACHMFKGSEQAGNLGPPLVSMKSRFPNRERLTRILNEPQSALSPFTMMPPFGRNGILDQKEIDSLIDFLYTL